MIQPPPKATLAPLEVGSWLREFSVNCACPSRVGASYVIRDPVGPCFVYSFGVSVFQNLQVSTFKIRFSDGEKWLVPYKKNDWQTRDVAFSLTTREVQLLEMWLFQTWRYGWWIHLRTWQAGCIFESLQVRTCELVLGYFWSKKL